MSLHGSQLSPIGQGTITLTQATVADEPIQSANLDFTGTGDEIRGKLGLRMPAGAAQSNFTYFPKRKAYDGDLQATGIRLEQLHTLQARNINLTGTLNLNAKGSGTFDDPGVQFTAQIPKLQFEDQTVNGFTLQADVANHVANVNLDSQSQTLNTFVKGRGRVNLTGNYETDATFDTSTISLQPLIAVYLPAESADFSGQTEVHGTVKGPLKDMARLDAHITIPMLSLSYKNKTQLAAAQPIQIDYSRGILNLQKTVIRGTGTDLQLRDHTGRQHCPLPSGAGNHRSQPRPDARSDIRVPPDSIQHRRQGLRSNPNVQGKSRSSMRLCRRPPAWPANGNGARPDNNHGNRQVRSVAAEPHRYGWAYVPAVDVQLAVAGSGIRTPYRRECAKESHPT